MVTIMVCTLFVSCDDEQIESITTEADKELFRVYGKGKLSTIELNGE